MNPGKERTWDNPDNGQHEVIVHTATIPKDKIEQVQPRKKQPQVASVKSDVIRIVPDNIHTVVPTQKEMPDAVISDQTKTGVTDPGGIQSNDNGNGNGNEPAKKDDELGTGVILTQSDAQFPGGKDAFAKFLTRNLVTPGDLEAGEKKIVLVRFKVDVDGTISKTEIMQSDGDSYAHEVLRVLSKMPIWIPAMQNGNKVATWFTQAVTFIGIEQ